MKSRFLRISLVTRSRLPSVRTMKWFPLEASLIWTAYVRGPIDLKYFWNKILGSDLTADARLEAALATGWAGAAERAWLGFTGMKRSPYHSFSGPPDWTDLSHL